MTTLVFCGMLLCGAGESAAPSASHLAAAHPPCPCQCRANGAWQVAETPNFTLWVQASETEARGLAQYCEAMRGELVQRWGPADAGMWMPRCLVVVHSHADAYAKALGLPQAASVGCTSVQQDGERVVLRRIDLRRDAADWRSNALPHELTHVVLADRVRLERVPRWLDEGLAMTSEASALHQRRQGVLQKALADGRLLDVPSVLRGTVPRAETARDVFYSQSHALVHFLLERDGSDTLMGFIAAGQRDGYEQALLDLYGFTSVSELEATWRDSLAGARDIPASLLVAVERDVTLRALQLD